MSSYTNSNMQSTIGKILFLLKHHIVDMLTLPQVIKQFFGALGVNKILNDYSAGEVAYCLSYNNFEYSYIHPSFSDLLGYSPQEMQKIGILNLIREVRVIDKGGIKNIEPKELFNYRYKAKEIKKWQADYLIVSKDGNEVWISDISYPWYEDKVIIGAVGWFRDITERVVAENKIRETLLTLANIDYLTQIANRKSFFEQLDLELMRTRRTKQPLSMLLIDIDFFKQINDQYGHYVGDKILYMVANKIKSCLRETDIVARIGGEEFGVLLPDTPLEAAYWVADRICNCIRDYSFKVGEQGTSIECTVSIGVSASNASKEVERNNLYKAADIRLYIAKNTGRNQVSVDEILHMH
jgi:diguanylate cyclase (GGDEF)-like protein/PAS domain S-box-containing protein